MFKTRTDESVNCELENSCMQAIVPGDPTLKHETTVKFD